MKILLLPGDGIGPEIMTATEKALTALDAKFGLGLALETRDVGEAALAKHGSTVPNGLIDHARTVDAVILGPVDTAAYPPAAEGGINPSATFRRELDLYANIRPSRTRPGVPALTQMDLVVVRENTEGFYADRTMFAGGGEFMPTPDLALAVRKITRHGSERVVRAACEIAMMRNKRLTIVNKSNVLKLSDGLFLEAAATVCADYPELEVEEILVDAMASLLVRNPGDYDVLVSTNMFGDILSNEAAELSGGLGLAPSINAGDDIAIAQASHGAAPDIAGHDAANPAALISSTAMLLDWIGRRSGNNVLVEAAAATERAVDDLLADTATHTPDLGGSLGTGAYGDALAARIGEN
ncbi:MAG: isocitrate/isopropylmalate dehydrogenase [Paracoccaceae bacterium]|jgi:isocitrate/isopropylmalate dehydrogenase